MSTVDLQFFDSGSGTSRHGLSTPPLVLIHGIGASARDWEYVLPDLSRDRRVIIPDLRGHGRSPPGESYSVPTLAADVWTLLDRLQVSRFDLVGHSMGGAVALQMAVDRPERLNHTVFADTLPSFVVDTPAKALLYWSRVVLMTLLGPRGVARTLGQH